MKTMLVAGAAGGVGEAVVRAILAAGHRVIAPSRSDERLTRLRADVKAAAIPDAMLVTMTGDVGTLNGARAIRDRVAHECGAIDVLIPSLGGWWEGRIADVTLDDWDSVMHEMLRTHVVFAQTFLPVLRAQPHGGRYLAMGGGAAYHPIRNSSLVSIAGAAQLMYTRALHAENADAHVDILELVVDGPIRTRDSEPIAEDHWILAGDVARVTRELAETGTTDAPGTRTSGPIVRMRPAGVESGAV